MKSKKLRSSTVVIMLLFGFVGYEAIQVKVVNAFECQLNRLTFRKLIIARVSVATPGVKLSYTVPSPVSKTAYNISRTFRATANVTARFEIVADGSTGINIGDANDTNLYGVPFALENGDTVRLNVITGVSGATADVTFSIVECDGQTSSLP